MLTGFRFAVSLQKPLHIVTGLISEKETHINSYLKELQGYADKMVLRLSLVENNF